MRTMHPVLKRGALFWDHELLPPACYAQRYARIKALIAESGDDAWLIYGDVERYGHVAYFSNFLPRTRSALALVPHEGDPAILLSVGQRDIPAAKTLTWIDDVRPFSKLGTQACALITEKGLAHARFGLVGVEEQIALADWTDISTGLPDAQWQTRTEAVSRLRTSKDAWERAALRRSAAAVTSALDRVADVARPGTTTRAIAAAADRVLRREAAEDVRVLIAASAHGGLSLRPPDDRVLQAGDTIMIYVAGEVQRYWAEGAGTFSLGPVSPALRALAAAAAAALTAMRAAAVPGVPVSDILARANAALEDNELRASANAYGLGHGIGLDAEEAPFVVAGASERLVAGTTLALRVIGHSAGHGIALGQMIVVGAHGAEILVESLGPTECTG
jgi:Xaa-Pro aminopeptidase